MGVPPRPQLKQWHIPLDGDTKKEGVLSL